MSASQCRARWLLAWFALGFVLLEKSNVIAATTSMSSSCGSRGKSLNTVSNRMINIRRSFRNGAEELVFTRASTRSKCSDMCCSYDGCDTSMFIGPSAAVWKSRSTRTKFTGGNCALLACNHMCVVDSALHLGIFISKIVDVPRQALPWRPTADEMVTQTTTIGRSAATVEETVEAETTTLATTTAATSASMTTMLPTTMLPTTLVEETTKAALVQGTTEATLVEGTTQSPTTDIATEPMSTEGPNTQELRTANHPTPTTSAERTLSIAPVVDIAVTEGKMSSPLLQSSEVATDTKQYTTAASQVSNDNEASTVESTAASEAVKLLAGEEFQKSTSPNPEHVNANSRFSSTPTLIIALSVGLVVFFAVFFLVTRQWVRFAKTKIHKQKEDYLINGMYA